MTTEAGADAASTQQVEQEGAQDLVPARTVRTVDRERGAASAELAGMIMVIVLLISALLIAAGSGGLGAQYENLLCRAFSWFGTSCTAPPPLAVDREPDAPCTVLTNTSRKSIGVTVVADLDSGGSVTLETMSDNTYRVTADSEASLGLGFGGGGGVSVTWDDKKVGGLVQAGGGAAVAAQGGASWTFDNKADAQQLVDYFDRKITNATTPVVGSAMSLYDATKDFFSGSRYQPPPPTEYAGELSLKGNLSASAVGVANAGTGQVGGAVSLGATVNAETKETTVYYATAIEGSADVRDGLSTASASGELLGVLAVTISPEGEYLTNVSYETVLYGDAGYEAYAMFNSVADGGSAGGVVLKASVDLTDEESTLIAYDLLRASGIPPSQFLPPSTGSGMDVPAFTALKRLVDASLERGEVTRQEITGSSSTALGLEGSGDVGIGIGARYESSTSERQVTGAQYYDGSRWVDWTSCVAS